MTARSPDIIGAMAHKHMLMTTRTRGPLHRNLSHHAAQLAHSRDEFQGELPSLEASGSALVPRPVCFFQYHFWLNHSHRLLVEMVSRPARRHASDHRSTCARTL